MADLPKKKPVPPVPYGDNDVNDYMQGKTNKKQLLARVDDRFGRKDPMENRSDNKIEDNLQTKFNKESKGGFFSGEPKPIDRNIYSPKTGGMSYNPANLGFKKGGVVKGKSVPQSQKKNRKKG